MLEGDWNAKQVEFMHWLATPVPLRQPATHEEFADYIGRTSRTLRNWKQLPGFKKAVSELVGDYVDYELANVYHGLLKEAKKGKVSPARLILEARGIITNQPDVQQNINVTPFSAEELAQAQRESQAWRKEIESA